MKKVTIEDKHFKLFIESKKIISEIDQLSSKINAYYANKKPIFICVLNGAFLFASELIKRFDHECEVSFVKLSSYEGINSSGVVKNLIGLNENIKGRDLIIVEDIVDTGNTIDSVYNNIKTLEPNSLEVATLLFKPDAYKKKYPLNIQQLLLETNFL